MRIHCDTLYRHKKNGMKKLMKLNITSRKRGRYQNLASLTIIRIIKLKFHINRLLNVYTNGKMILKNVSSAWKFEKKSRNKKNAFLRPTVLLAWRLIYHGFELQNWTWWHFSIQTKPTIYGAVIITICGKPMIKGPEYNNNYWSFFYAIKIYPFHIIYCFWHIKWIIALQIYRLDGEYSTE